MKTRHAIMTVLFASLLASALSFAAEMPEGERFELKVMADDELVSIDATGLEIGESRQSFSESGKEVLVTRTEDGFQLAIDGKDIDVDLHHGGSHHGGPHHGDHASFNMTGGEGKKIIIHKLHGEADCDDCSGYHFMHADEGEDADVVIERFNVADRLAESGVLDGLDEEKRREILDSLRQMQPHGDHHQQVRIMVEKKIQENDEDQ